MHKYYKGTLKKMTIKNIEIYNGIMSIEMKGITLKKDELFYKSRFGSIKSFSTKFPVMNEKQAQEFLAGQTAYLPKNELEKAFCLYTPYQELVPYSMTKSEEKKLIKQRRKDKNSI